jgi:5'-nucleotidase
MGIPAIAVSQVLGEHFSFVPAGQVARHLAALVLERGLPKGTLLNVNVPPTPPKGLRFTRLGKRRYMEGVVEDTDPRGRTCYWIGGGDPVWEYLPGSDYVAVAEGYTSVTPLQLDMTDESLLQTLLHQAASWEFSC